MSIHRFGIALLLSSLVILALSTAGMAQLPQARFSSMVPLSGNPGQTFGLTIAGTDLDDATKLTFSHRGIVAKQKLLPLGPFDKTPQPAEHVFEVTIAGNVPAGRYEVRTTGKYGTSNSRTFFVSPVAQAAEIEPNNKKAEATPLSLPADCSGLLATSTDVDFFTIKPEVAQRVILDCYARRADSAADAVVTVYDQIGREVTSSRDAHRHDPLIDFQAAAGQTYTIEVRDAAYRGGSDYQYRFVVGALPHIDYVFPPAAEAGGNRPFVVYGRNLPGGQNAGLTIGGRPLEKLAVNISLPAATQPPAGMYVEPASGNLNAVPFGVSNSVGPSNKVMVGVAAAPPLLEKEPNNAPSQAQPLTVPSEVMGQFLGNRDEDWYSFEAKAGEQLAVEVISNRLGLPSDPTIMIQRIDPPNEGESEPKIVEVAYVTESEIPDSGPEFFTRNSDPTYLFTADVAGTYRLLLRDRHNALQVDPRHVYRLLVRQAKPDFHLAVVPVGSYSSLLLQKGGQVGLRVIAFRHHGFSGEIQVTATDLPAGVTCHDCVIGPDRSCATLTLAAAGNAAPGTANLSVTGSSQIGTTAVKRTAALATATLPLPPRQNNNLPAPPTTSRFSDSLVLTVSAGEPAPTALSAGNGKVWETSRAGILKIPYSHAGPFKGKFTLSAEDLPANIDASTLTINPNQNSGEYEIKLKSNTPVGTYTFHLAGVAEQVDFSRNPEAAAEAAERQKEVDAIALEATALSKAATQAKADADKAASDAMAAVQQATAAHAQAEQTLSQATASRDTAQTQLATAKKQLASQADDATRKAAVSVAEKLLAEQQAGLTAATTALAAAEKSLTEAKAAEEMTSKAQAAATLAATEATDRAKLAAELKAATDKRAKELADAAKPKKINVPVLSTPITLKITATPIDLTPLKAEYVIKQGEKLEIPLALARKYGHSEAVTFSAKAPGGVGGISIPNAQVPAKGTTGKLEVAANATATPGSHEFTLTIATRVNNQTVTIEEPFTLTVQEVKPPEK